MGLAGVSDRYSELSQRFRIPEPNMHRFTPVHATDLQEPPHLHKRSLTVWVPWFLYVLVDRSGFWEAHSVDSKDYTVDF